MQEEVAMETDLWLQLPDSVLLIIFGYLQPDDILRCAQSCKQWLLVARDQLLWRDVFHCHWRLHKAVPLAPGRTSWLEEHKRLKYHVPMVESEVLTAHTDQVLHVAFSHKGDMFATSSKDGTIKVWASTYPANLKYSRDMREFTWKYTQFSQFNDTDTLLLVSGVHFGSNSTSGEIAVFSVQGDFELQCRVMNKPYDIFGTWYNDTHLLSGNLHWIGDLSSCSALWLNKAYQDVESEHESVVMRIFKFLNKNASSIRTIMIAPCPEESKLCSSHHMLSSPSASFDGAHPQFVGHNEARDHGSEVGGDGVAAGRSGDGGHPVVRDEQLNAPIEYNEQYRNAGGAGDWLVQLDDIQGLFEFDVGHSLDMNQHQVLYESSNLSAKKSLSEQVLPRTAETVSDSPQPNAKLLPSAQAPPGVQMPTGAQVMPGAQAVPPGAHAVLDSGTGVVPCSAWDRRDKYLIFTMGAHTYTPHLIGVKKIRYKEAAQKMGLRLSGNTESLPPVEENRQMLDRAVTDYDSADYTIELNGHIIGMCLSPDHRYLYVNCRTWPKNYAIKDALNPPPIAQEIDIHVIDLVTMKEVGTMHRAHRAYTPNDECFFIFLDVCNEYVASGAEDNHGYVWDRHYGMCLTKYPHTDVVNSVAFNPRDSEMLISVSDDMLVKVWRSRNRMAQIEGSKGHKSKVT